MTKIIPDELSRALNKSGRDYTRELVRQRDNRTCQKCGKIWVIGTRRLDVHHIYDCGSKTLAYDSVKDIDRMITLCHKCHIGLDSVREKISTRTGMFKHSPQRNNHSFYKGKDILNNK